jgi:hypothetical protein
LPVEGQLCPLQQTSPALHAFPLMTQQAPAAPGVVPQSIWPLRQVPWLSQQSEAVRQAPFTGAQQTFP